MPRDNEGFFTPQMDAVIRETVNRRLVEAFQEQTALYGRLAEGDAEETNSRGVRLTTPVRRRTIAEESYFGTYGVVTGNQREHLFRPEVNTAPTSADVMSHFYGYRAMGQSAGTQRGYQVGDIVRYIRPNADYFDQLFEVATQFTLYVHARALTADGYLRDEIHQFYNTAIKLEEAVDANI